ncbi:MAG: O-antigen ligase family protein [Planctomycetes bacterium]|nr:O-antigen ligase family protein [Planctomycetota bacterium]
MENKFNAAGGISKPLLQKCLEGLILTAALCALVLRATFTEAPNTPPTNPLQPLSNDAISLLISMVLVVSALLWFVCIFLRKGSRYRFSGIEIGLGIFIVAGVIAVFAASNKRAAITDFATITAPILMAAVLVQILDSTAKIKLLLLIVIALGAVSAHQCMDQFFSSNDEMIRDYMNNPDAQLAARGIKTGSFEQFLYEHRLFSKDIRGFLLTSNSTGSFLLLAAFVAIGMFVEKARHSYRSAAASVLCFGFMTAVVITGLVFTKSKGALAAGVSAMVIFIVIIKCRSWIYRHRKPIVFLFLICIVLGTIAVAGHGQTHGTLPGGNSMLVRWQYWSTSIKMYLQKPMTGLGGANFKTYYTHFKPDNALETVSDPHNFVLSILTQYGPFGLAGFLLAVTIPVYGALFRKQDAEKDIPHSDETSPVLKAFIVFAMLMTLLLIRPLVRSDQLGDTTPVIISVILILYVMPAGIFVISFCITSLSAKNYPVEDRFSYALKPAIIAGLIAVLIANLIDFAIFEPAVSTLFWTMIAVLIAIDFNNGNRSAISISAAARRSVSLIAATAVVVFISIAVIPPVRSSAKTRLTFVLPMSYANKLLDRAADLDKLDPLPCALNGRVMMADYEYSKDTAVLEKAAKYFDLAIIRNDSDFKNYANLGRVYEKLAKASSENKKRQLLEKAYDMTARAVKRYPGSAELRIEFAKIAEKLDLTDDALRSYKKAIDIEDAYRRQFKIMYPGREEVSRLSAKEYSFAKERIEALSSSQALP